MSQISYTPLVDGDQPLAAGFNTRFLQAINLLNAGVEADNIANLAITTGKLASKAVSLAKMEDGTQGDVLYYGASGVIARLGYGTSGQFLKTQGASSNPIWATVTGIATGAVTMWGGAIASPPTGYLVCNGATFSQTTYPDLATVLGDIWGTHSGDNYYLPNFSNKFPYGANEGSSAGNASVGSSSTGSGALAGNDNSVTMASAASSGTISTTGGGDSSQSPAHTHNVMPPYLAISFIIKT